MTPGDSDPGLILNPEYWGRNGFPHAAARWLRENDPIRWYESELVDPFWLVTRHDDVKALFNDRDRVTPDRRCWSRYVPPPDGTAAAWTKAPNPRMPVPSSPTGTSKSTWS